MYPDRACLCPSASKERANGKSNLEHRFPTARREQQASGYIRIACAPVRPQLTTSGVIELVTSIPPVVDICVPNLHTRAIPP